MNGPALKIGIANRRVIHHDTESDYSLETFFDQVASTGMFDYLDKTPAPEEFDVYLFLANKYALSINCGGEIAAYDRPPQVSVNPT